MKGADEKTCTGIRCGALTKGKGLIRRQLKGSKDRCAEEEMQAAKTDPEDLDDRRNVRGSLW